MNKVTNYPKKIEIDFTDEAITPNAGSLFLSQMAQKMGLPKALAENIHVKKRNRGATDSEMLLSLIYNLAQGDGALLDLERLGADEPRQKLLGLGAVPNPRRVGEYLARFEERSNRALWKVARTQQSQIAATVIESEVEQRGYVPVFVDGSEIEVEGQGFEHAGYGYTKNLQYWLHNVFVGPLWASQRLQPGGVHVTHGWEPQLLHDVCPLLPPSTPVWVRADNAYYDQAFVRFCTKKGWDYSISVTNDTYKKPLREALREDDPEWEWINDDQTEEATLIYYQPYQWDRMETYVAVRSYWDGRQKLLHPRLLFILVSREDLPLKELVRRHREKQGQENLQKGPLLDLDLHHPPCSSFQANRAFYTAGQLAHNLLLAIQYKLLPKSARHHRIRTLIRDLIRTAGRLVTHGRKWILKFSKSALRLAWISTAASRLEEYKAPAPA